MSNIIKYYYCIILVKRLAVCEELEKSSCGSILFYAQLNPPGKYTLFPLSLSLTSIILFFSLLVFDELSLETQQAQVTALLKPGTMSKF